MTPALKYFYLLSERLFGGDFSVEGFSRYLKNIKWMTLARLFTMLFSLATTTIIARLLGPTTFGALSYVISFVGLFAIVAGLGIDNVTFKEVTAEKERREEILGSSLLLRGITGFIAVALVVLVLFFSTETFYIKKLIFILSFSFITQPLLLLGYDFLKDSEAKYVAITQISSMFISNVLKILVIFFTHSLAYFLFLVVLESLISGALYLMQMRIFKKRSISFKLSKKQILLTLTLSLPLTLYSAFYELYARIDQIMIRHYLDVQSVGYYAAAMKITEIWYTVPNILMAALFPAFVNTREDTTEYNKRLKIMILTLLGSSLIIAFLTTLFGKTLTYLIYGDQFLPAAHILSIYIYSLVGSFLSFIIYQDLFIRNKLITITLIPLFTALTNIGLNILFIPRYHEVGAAMGTVISYTLIPIIYVLTTKLFKEKI